MFSFGLSFALAFVSRGRLIVFSSVFAGKFGVSQ